MKPQILELTYGVRLERDDNGFLVTFRDLSNVFSGGETRAEAMMNAQEALEGVLMEMVVAELEIPLPSAIPAGEEAISVSPDVAAPVMLLMLRQQSGQTMAKVAHTMAVKTQTYQRLEKTGRYLTLKSLKRAAKALGATVELRLRKI